MVFGAIVAGGIGKRMTLSDSPKQFLPLGSRPIIIHTIEKFLSCPYFTKVYVGIHPSWRLHFEDMLTKYGLSQVGIANGGQDRNSTVFSIVDKIYQDFKISKDDTIVTHDAVRPFVTLETIAENIEAAAKFGACDTVIPAVDTIVTSQDGCFISSIPPREHMLQGQTPQSFKLSLLRETYNSLTQTERETLTDCAKIFTLKGLPVRLVQGHTSNFKITTPHDYKVAQAMVEGTACD